MSPKLWNISVTAATFINHEERQTAAAVVASVLALLDELPEARGSYVTLNIAQAESEEQP